MMLLSESNTLARIVALAMQERLREAHFHYSVYRVERVSQLYRRHLYYCVSDSPRKQRSKLIVYLPSRSHRAAGLRTVAKFCDKMLLLPFLC